METIFDHRVTKAELKEYGASYITRTEYLKHITNQEGAYSDIASLYANRGKWDMAEKYRILSGFYNSLPKGMAFDECLPYKLA